MRWKEERYVRAYTRDTTELVNMSWQARAIWWEILRKADRGGIIELDRSGLRGLANLIHVPFDVVEAFLPELTAEDAGDIEHRPPVVIRGRTLIVRNYVEAQEAPQTDAARKRAERERRAQQEAASAEEHAARSIYAMRGNVTSVRPLGHDVTPSDPIHPSHTDPSRAEPSDARAREAPPVEHPAESPEVVELLAELERHPDLAPIAKLDVAEKLEGRRMSSGKPLAHVLAAIRELAADVVPGWSEEILRRKVRAYCDRAGPPRAGPASASRRSNLQPPADPGREAWTAQTGREWLDELDREEAAACG